MQIATHLKRMLNLELGLLLLLLLLALILGTYHLEYYPMTWFDEGWWLQVPRNLVQYGQYATRSSEGFRSYDTVVGASPAFYLPIALAFKIGGIGLAQARLVMVAYFLLTCLLLYAVARELYGWRVALVALALFILVKPDDGFTSALLLGRQVMAEVPALCFLMAGTLAWLRSFKGRTSLLLGLSGLFWGLAVTTKSQLLLGVLPMLAVLAALDGLYYRQRRYQHYVIPFIGVLVVMGLQYAFILAVNGPDAFSRYLTEFAEASGPQVRVLLSPVAMQTGLKFFLRSGYVVWLLPALLSAILGCVSRKAENIRSCLPWVFVSGWLAWFLVASVGWARYAFPALAVSYMLVARLLDDLAEWSAFSLSQIRHAIRTWDWASVVRPVSMMLLLVMLLLNSSRDVIKGIFSAPDSSPQQFAAYVQAHVGKDDLIETWEWGIAFLVGDHAFHHPPTSLLNALIAHENLGTPYDASAYDFQQYAPKYIIVGPFAEWTGLYPSAFLEKCTLVVSIGQYSLFKVNGGG